MLEKPISRRSFLVGGGAVLAAAATPAILRPALAKAAPSPTPLPWAIDTAIDPLVAAELAYETYFKAGCAEATWWPIVHLNAVSTNIDASATWATIPPNMFKFGGGGVASWGTICGTLNGSCAAIAMTGADSSLEDALMEYYGDTPLPTNGTDNAFRAGSWHPATSPLNNVVTSTAHSQLCHVSLSQWAMAAGYEGADTTTNAIGKPGQKDRCAKLCFDMTYRTVEMLNAWFKSSTKPVVNLDPSVAACKTCHAPNAMGKMACGSCHDVDDAHASGN